MKKKKITLSMNEEIIGEAKRIAKRNGKSVSELFSDFVRILASQKRRSRISPNALKATGLVRHPINKSDKEIVMDAIFEKHDLIGLRLNS